MQQFQSLRERSVDLLIGRMPRPFVEDDLEAEILFDEPFRAVVGATSTWARRRRVALSDLLHEPWVLPPYDSGPGILIGEIFAAAGLQPPPPSVATMSAQLTVSLIAAGRFVGILPRSVAQFNAGPDGLKILPMILPPSRLGAGIIKVKKRTLSPLAELFMACARELAGLQGISGNEGKPASRCPQGDAHLGRTTPTRRCRSTPKTLCSGGRCHRRCVLIARRCEIFVTAFKVFPSLKVTFGDQLSGSMMP